MAKILPNLDISKFKRRLWLPVTLIAAAGTCLSVLLVFYAYKAERQRLLAEFQVAANQPILEINNLIQTNLATVQSLAAFYVSSEHVSRQEFKAFASSNLSRHNSIQALEWLPKVSAKERKAYVLGARLDGFPDFRITERAENGSLVPAKSRPEYFPVYYVEPLSGNEVALGFDVLSETTRMATLARARQTGQVTVSDPIFLVQSTRNDFGVLVSAPVFSQGLSLEGGDSEKKLLMGFVLAVLQISKLIDTAISPWLDTTLFGDILVFAAMDEQTPKLVFAHQAASGELPEVVADIPEPYASELIQVANREWQVFVRPPAGWPTASDLWLPWSLLIASFVLTAGASIIYRMRLLGILKLEVLARSLQAKNDRLEIVSRALAKYLPRQLWDNVLNEEKQRSIGAEQKGLTILFGDVVGFTRLSNELQPNELMFILNDFFSEMSAIGLRHGATLDKFVGDAVIMFFGDPTSNGTCQDARSCVRMAIEMQQRMNDLRIKWKHLGYPNPLHIRIGIHSGVCNVGNFGSDERMSYTIIGADVNLTARVEKLGKPDSVTLTEETFQLVRGQFEITPYERIYLKGLGRNVNLYSVNVK